MPLVIPGAREASRKVPREAGTIGGAANGSDARSGEISLDEATLAERRKEGGGSYKVTRRRVGGV
jgi:hypothetical protein